MRLLCRVYAIETSATLVLPYETARELFYDSGSHGTSIQSRYCGSHQFALFSYQSAYALTSQLTRFIHQIRYSMVSHTKKNPRSAVLPNNGNLYLRLHNPLFSQSVLFFLNSSFSLAVWAFDSVPQPFCQQLHHVATNAPPTIALDTICSTYYETTPPAISRNVSPTNK
jgi:hypothetical protein